jgi:hypothetical protein
MSSGIRVNVTGTASDVGSGVRVVELTLDNNIRSIYSCRSIYRCL